MKALDWKESVIERRGSPGTQTIGNRYLITVGTGDWVGKDNNLVEWNGTEWEYTEPESGMATYVENENLIYLYDGSWGALSTSLQDLQSAYDISPNPEIQTNSTNGALTIRRGSSLDTDNVIEVVNGAGALVMGIDGEGTVKTNKISEFSGSGVTIENILVDNNNLENVNFIESSSGSGGVTEIGNNLNLLDISPEFRINSVSVLNSTTLGSTVVNSSLTSVGTLTGLSVNGDVDANRLTVDNIDINGNTIEATTGDINLDCGNVHVHSFNVGGTPKMIIGSSAINFTGTGAVNFSADEVNVDDINLNGNKITASTANLDLIAPNGDIYNEARVRTTVDLRLASHQAIDGQGGYLQWNRDSTGRTFLVNQRGIGLGGISFGKSDTSNVYTEFGAFDNDGNFSIQGSRIEVGNLDITTDTISNTTGDINIEPEDNLQCDVNTDHVYNFKYEGNDVFRIEGDSGFGTVLKVQASDEVHRAGIIAPNSGRAALFVNSLTGWDIDGHVYCIGLRTGLSGNNVGITASGELYEIPSSKRFKENIVSSKYGLDSIMKMNPVEYNYIGQDSGKFIGLIAEELHDIVPEAITFEKDGKTPRGIDYLELVPVCIKAIQELSKGKDVRSGTPTVGRMLARCIKAEKKCEDLQEQINVMGKCYEDLQKQLTELQKSTIRINAL